MLSSLVKDHQAKQAVRKEEHEQKKKEAIAATNELSQAVVDHLNVGVAQAYLNQKRLDAEAKQLHASANNFSRQTYLWMSQIDAFSNALKEIGDVENWATSIQNDLIVVNETLNTAYKKYREANNT